MLERFDLNKFYILESWVTDEDLLFQFAGDMLRYPFTIMQMKDLVYRSPEREYYYGLDEEGNYFAYGEIIPQEEDRVPRIGRILIGDPNKRGKGLGRKFINELIEKCKAGLNAKAVELYVLDYNDQAIGLYEKLGFRFKGDSESKIMKFKGKNHLARKMRLEL